MQTLIEQDPPALSFPSSAPATTRVIGFGAEPIGHDPAYANNPAQFTRLNEALNVQIARFGTKLEHAGEDEVGFCLVGGNEAFGIGFMGGNGFFNHDVQALVESGNTESGVLVMRGGDNDRIDQA